MGLFLRLERKDCFFSLDSSSKQNWTGRTTDFVYWKILDHQIEVVVVLSRPPLNTDMYFRRKIPAAKIAMQMECNKMMQTFATLKHESVLENTKVYF